MDVVYAIDDVWLSPEIFIRKGEIWDAHDPLVEQKPGFFTSDPSRVLRRSVPVVEQATAEPGEFKRGPGRPRKDGNGPWA